MKLMDCYGVAHQFEPQDVVSVAASLNGECWVIQVDGHEPFGVTTKNSVKIIEEMTARMVPDMIHPKKGIVTRWFNPKTIKKVFRTPSNRIKMLSKSGALVEVFPSACLFPLKDEELSVDKAWKRVRSECKSRGFNLPAAKKEAA